jgi:hypothetical protein
MKKEKTDHICVRHAICFRCFRTGVEKTRARQDAWAQRSLPFEAVLPELSPREIAHRRQMLAHLTRRSQRS